MASVAEREIRDAVTAWFHANEPCGRVVHELPLSSFSGEGRADLGVIFPDHIVLVEIKSERDKLSRLEKQWDAMSRRCHDMKIVCHEKWFDTEGGLKDQSWLRWSHKEHLWRWPASTEWDFSRYKSKMRPGSYDLMSMLWADELRDCYKLAGAMASSPNMNMWGMTADLHDKLNGRQVRQAVCALLRARKFSEADPIIPLSLPAPPPKPQETP